MLKKLSRVAYNIAGEDLLFQTFIGLDDCHSGIQALNVFKTVECWMSDSLRKQQKNA